MSPVDGSNANSDNPCREYLWGTVVRSCSKVLESEGIQDLRNEILDYIRRHGL